jgi:hypothetical protein
MRTTKDKQSSFTSSGDALVSYFQSVQLSLGTIDALEYRANRTEASTLEAIDSLNSQSVELINGLADRSLRAHVQKSQALKAKVLSAEKIKGLQQEVEKDFLKRRVSVSALDKNSGAISICWYSPRQGNFHFGKKHPRTVKGRIAEIDLEKNLVVVRPTFIASKLNKTLQSYFVRVIEMSDFSPLVNFTLS